mmetsp:Transcript_14879/g.31914  ORF Transcript_14879/g.31914 Transcript_14879/m.31914 type:complete len:93 (-) Transcript_14879:372-650(-)
MQIGVSVGLGVGVDPDAGVGVGVGVPVETGAGVEVGPGVDVGTDVAWLAQVVKTAQFEPNESNCWLALEPSDCLYCTSENQTRTQRSFTNSA